MLSQVWLKTYEAMSNISFREYESHLGATAEPRDKQVDDE